MKFNLLILALGVLFFQSCSSFYFRANYKQANDLIYSTSRLQTKSFLKAHMQNGDVFILNQNWNIDSTQTFISGYGTQYDFNRKKIEEGSFYIVISNVALFETNNELINPEALNIGILSTVAVINVAVNLFCIAQPKACYGSCPTFYINENDNFHYADAEGFSNAIVPSMEYSDIDALKIVKPIGNEFNITMKNEALETHYVNDVKLYAFPVNENEFVFHTPENKFYLCQNNYTLTKAIGNEGDITTLLAKPDINERFSLSDNKNLNSKEELFFNFNNVLDINSLGFILNFRQTLMTTYLFYNSMGYMGNEFGDLFVKLEKDSSLKKRFDATTQLLGGIDLYSFNEKTKCWDFENTFNETGPIAINKQLIALKQKNYTSTVKLKLVLNKGFWRIDFAGLTNINKEVIPTILGPTSLLKNGKSDTETLATLFNDNKYIISKPGNEFKFGFKLPSADTKYALFLYSKGYYMEWMRKDWLKDKNLPKLRQMVYKPSRFLKKEAKNYKKYESQMESIFWNSKIDTKSFSLYEK
jgi:hypothetical protein